MENPACWKPAELVISDALDDFDKFVRKGGAIGASEPHAIAEYLRRAGWLRDQEESEIGWDKLRAHQAERKGKPAPEPVQRRPKPKPFGFSSDLGRELTD